MGCPTLPETNVHAKSIQIYPSECRERASTYKAPLNIALQFIIEGQTVNTLTIPLGQIPIMVKVCYI